MPESDLCKKAGTKPRTKYSPEQVGSGVIFHFSLYVNELQECITAEMPIFQTEIILQTNNLIRVPFALTGNFLLKSACIGPWASAVT